MRRVISLRSQHEPAAVPSHVDSAVRPSTCGVSATGACVASAGQRRARVSRANESKAPSPILCTRVDLVYSDSLECSMAEVVATMSPASTRKASARRWPWPPVLARAGASRQLVNLRADGHNRRRSLVLARDKIGSGPGLPVMRCINEI